LIKHRGTTPNIRVLVDSEFEVQGGEKGDGTGEEREIEDRRAEEKI